MRPREPMFVAQADKRFLRDWAEEISGRFRRWITPDHLLSAIVIELRRLRSQRELFDELPSRLEAVALRIAKQEQRESDKKGAEYARAHRHNVSAQAARVEKETAHRAEIAQRELIAYRAMERLRGKLPPAMLDKLLSHVEAAMLDGRILKMGLSEIHALVHRKLAEIEKIRAERKGPLDKEAEEKLEVAHGELLMLRVMEEIAEERRAA